jgi:hypothetical protein
VGLRDTAALHEWRERESPRQQVWDVVNQWVQGLDSASWQAPSTPFPELSEQPFDEVRSAVVPGSDEIEVFYRHEYRTGAVDLIWVGMTKGGEGGL